jgi:flagellar motor switch protein FliG
VGEICCPCNPFPDSAPKHELSGIDLAGRILERLDRAVWQTILDDISRNDPELAGNIRQRMLLFEDIARMADMDIHALLMNVEDFQLAIALQSTNEEFREKIYKNMSKRTAKILQEEIERYRSWKQSNIEIVQREIVYTMRCLIHAGELTGPKSDM